MSFREEEIAEEFAESVSGRREFFSSDSYSFRRLAKLEGLDPKLLKRLKNTRYRKTHPEEVRAYWRAWRAANPERAQLYTSRYAKTAKGSAVTRNKKRRWQQNHRDAYNAAQRVAYARRRRTAVVVRLVLAALLGALS